jgi:hypothetical protein
MTANASDTNDSAGLDSSSSDRQCQDVIMLGDGRKLWRDHHSTGISMFLSGDRKLLSIVTGLPAPNAKHHFCLWYKCPMEH